MFDCVHLLTLLGLCLAVAVSDFEGERNYEGYRVYRLTPKTKQQLDVLVKWYKTDRKGIDFWSAPKDLQIPVDLQVNPDQLDTINKELSLADIKTAVVYKDLGKAVTKERTENSRELRFGAGASFKFNKHHRISEIHDWVDYIATRCPPGLTCSVKDIGRSFLNKTMKLIKIGANTTASKPAIWVDCGIHAREWVAPATCVYMIYRFIDDYSRGYTRVSALLQKYDLYFLPSANPDGYDYTWTNDRMWRKTRQPNAGSTCVGTDPNRNWGYKWMVTGASSNPCSNIYAGPTAFSEPETRAMRDFIQGILSNLKAYLSLHSYSQLILLPYGISTDVPPDFPELERAALAAADELKSVYGTTFRVGSSPAILYDSSGTSRDWAKYVGIKYSCTYELRDTGTHGFILPADQILPTAKETYKSIQRMAEELRWG